MLHFGALSTTGDVLAGQDLTGKRALITGTSAGLGIETARALAAAGAEVVGTARDLAKAEAATEAVRAAGAFSLVELDLASLASVRACADALAGQAFDIVIANAGVMATPFGRTADGFETQFGTNHLGHFVLINRLAPQIREGGRVVSLSSLAHHVADVDFDDPNFETTPYSSFVAYGRAKTANALFALEFDRRHRARGVRAASVHPGSIETELGRHIDPEIRLKSQQRVDEKLAAEGKPPMQWKTVPQGAATSIWAAVTASGDELAGRYCEDCHVAAPAVLGQGGTVMSSGVMPYAADPERAASLWAKSEELVGERF